VHHAASERASEGNKSKYKQSGAAPQQNRLMPIPVHKGSLAQSKAPSQFSIDTGKIFISSPAVNSSHRDTVRESERVKERVGGVAARGFSIFSLLLTQSVNTLSVMYRANQLLVFVWSLSLSRSPPRTQTKDRQPRTVCSQKVLLLLQLNLNLAARRESKKEMTRSLLLDNMQCANTPECVPMKKARFLKRYGKPSPRLQKLAVRGLKLNACITK